MYYNKDTWLKILKTYVTQEIRLNHVYFKTNYSYSYISRVLTNEGIAIIGDGRFKKQIRFTKLIAGTRFTRFIRNQHKITNKIKLLHVKK